MCSPEPIHMNSRGPIAPVGNHCPIRRLLAVGGCFKNLNPLSQQGAFAWPLPSVQVIHYRRAVDADRRVCVCVCVSAPGSQGFSLETSQLTAFGSACWVFVRKLSSAREPNTLCNCCSCQTLPTTMCTYCSQMKMDGWVSVFESLRKTKAFLGLFFQLFSSLVRSSGA